jgi:hypothetical protein
VKVADSKDNSIEAKRKVDFVLNTMQLLHVDLPWGSADASIAEALVRVGDRVVPNRISVDFPGRDGQPSLHLDLGVVNGVPQCRSLTVSSVDDGRAVRPVDLTAIKLNDWVADVFAAFAIEVDENGLGSKKYGGPAASRQTVAAAETFQRARRGKGARVVTPQLIEAAAQVYREHFDDRPIQAVMAAFGVTERTASGWITDARRKYNYLPETKRGKKSI